MLLIFALALISLSAVFANDNVTDVELNSLDDGSIISDEPLEEVNDTAVEKADSEIHAKSTKGYESFKTKFTVTLTSNNTSLASKQVKINLNGNNYTRTTNDAGQASVNVKLSKGSYVAKYYFLGDNDTNPSNGSAKITIKSPVKTVLKQSDANINYRQGSKTVFIVRLLTSSGACVKKQTVTFKVNGKKYDEVTNSKGYAQVFLNLKKGTHKVSYSFKANKPYLASSGHSKVKVKAALTKGNGYWVWGSTMEKVDLKALKSAGTKQIFLHSNVFDVYGKQTVSAWINKANGYGMKVHIWVEVFYANKWIKPLKKDGSPDYSLMKKKVSQIVKYAKIKGVSGIHLDKVQFDGTAMDYDNSVKAINYFVKKVCVEVRKVKENCIISAAVMPEPGMTEYYYGQDISVMSKYLDVIVPMAHKGNYGKQTSWIKYVTKNFVLLSNGAKIWTGLQGYKSVKNPSPLSYSALLKDAKAAVSGGAKGTMIFRIGMTKLLNFNKV